MSYNIRFRGFYFLKPKRTRWQFVAYPLLGLIRNDVISDEPRYQLSIDWLLWGIAIIIVFEKK